MSAQKNMTLARRFMEARVKGDLDALDEIMTPDYVSHAKLLPDQQPDREGEKWVVTQFAAVFSKRTLLIEDQVAGADKVVTRFIVHFTHDLGEIMGVAPSGRQMTNRGIVIHRIVEGKIAEEWGLGTLGSKLRGQSLEQERIERERVEQELKVARSIQHASLPKEVPQLEGWQISPYYQPTREVGGDISRAKRSVSPIARRAGSRDAKEGLPEEGSGGFTPLTIPRSYRIGLWPRTNDFQAHSASLFMGE